MNNSDSVKGLGLGLLIGAAIGFTLGILFAPQSGKETRALIKEKVVAAKAKAGEIVSKAKAAVCGEEEKTGEDTI
jgi:gas vesicle protein